MKVVAAAAAVEVVRSGDRVYVHCAAATPSVLLQALVDRAPELRDVTVVHLHTEGPGPHLAPEMAGHFRHRALFVGPNARQAVNEGRADYVPVFLSDIPRLFTSRALPLDVVFVNVTPPDAHGFCSLGHQRRGDACGDPVGDDGGRPAQPLDAAHARRQLHPRR